MPDYKCNICQDKGVLPLGGGSGTTRYACTDCDAFKNRTGITVDDNSEPCVTCNGTGIREMDIGDCNDVEVTCDDCHGTGIVQ